VTGARAAGVALLLVLAIAPPARAADVSGREFQALVERRAVAELRQVDSVDGRAVDVAGALGRGGDVDARLAQLQRTVAANGSTDARRDARDVLAQGRFHEKEVPGPFRSLIDRLADLIPSFDWLDDLLPGGRSIVWIVLAAILAAVATFVARRLLARRVGAAERAIAQAQAERAADPKALDRQADEAERAGDLETALRLRFRAGLLRLDRRGAIAFRPSISTREVQRALRSREFDGLASTFDDVVYGGREPAPEDVEAARARWPEVIDAA
jgi:Domain of unknown function (DUF4129)